MLVYLVHNKRLLNDLGWQERRNAKTTSQLELAKAALEKVGSSREGGSRKLLEAFTHEQEAAAALEECEELKR